LLAAVVGPSAAHFACSLSNTDKPYAPFRENPQRAEIVHFLSMISGART
jgi:hypothetical protein